MNAKLKKNLWWIISGVVLFVPLGLVINSLSMEVSEKLSGAALFFAITFVLVAVVGLVANKIKPIVLKVLWIILGVAFYLVYLTFTLLVILMSQPDDLEGRKAAFETMVVEEFSPADYLDKMVGIDLPEYDIVESCCTYVSSFPSETEYEVDVKLYLPKGMSKSLWRQITELAKTKAANPDPFGEVINEWYFDSENPGQICYKTEDSTNVGCVVTFKPKCDTVYVHRYKW